MTMKLFSRFILTSQLKIILLITGIVSYHVGQSQTSLDLTGGFNYSKLTGSDIGNVVKYKPGVHFGICFNTELAKFYFQQNLIYSRRGFRISKDMIESGKLITVDAQVNINSIDLPIVLGYNIAERFGVYSGIQFEYMYSSNYKAKAEYEGQPFLDYRAVENLINTDKYFTNGFSALGGIVYQFERLKIGFRYIHGITPISTSHNKKDYNALFQFTVNYEIFFWNKDEEANTHEE